MVLVTPVLFCSLLDLRSQREEEVEAQRQQLFWYEDIASNPQNQLQLQVLQAETPSTNIEIKVKFITGSFDKQKYTTQSSHQESYGYHFMVY